tara:strand:+ start:94 stop:207 length:114 start_codon:yes stop_codon:yes gene_type:complete
MAWFKDYDEDYRHLSKTKIVTRSKAKKKIKEKKKKKK